LLSARSQLYGQDTHEVPVRPGLVSLFSLLYREGSFRVKE